MDLYTGNFHSIEIIVNRIPRLHMITYLFDTFGGPYEDIGVIQEPGPLADVWEGLQGSDSFFPFKVDYKWLAFTGSAKTDTDTKVTG